METQLMVIQTNSETFKAVVPAFLLQCRLCDLKCMKHVNAH